MALMVVLVSLFAVAAAELPDVGIDDTLDERPISVVRLEGLRRVDEQLVLNNIRSAAGEAYDPEVVRQDVHRLTRLGQFKFIDADAVLQDDGTIELVFTLREQQIIAAVSVAGNKLITDNELLRAVPVPVGAPRDDFLIDRGRRGILDTYHARGNYLVEVAVDEQELNDAGVLIYRIMEGPRVRVKAIVFDGNQSFSDKELSAEMETTIAIPFFRRGELDEDVLDADVAKLDRWYRDRGFLDARVDRDITLSPDNREAKVTVLIDEGPQYTLGGISAVVAGTGAALDVFSVEQIRSLIPMKTGDIYRRDLLDDSQRAVREAYGAVGRVEVAVRLVPVHSSAEPVIDILMEINEGSEAKVGLVRINGNLLTKDKVIRRHVRLRPGRPFNAAEIQRAKDRILRTRLFNDVRITLLDEMPESPGYRDVLVEVKEADTGSLNFGVAVGTDSGVLGEISLLQRNFDIADVPESWSEFWRGRAFRGAGQDFSMILQPGDELFNYQIGLTEPYFLETDWSIGGSAGWKRRKYVDYTEERVYSRLRAGRRFGDIWKGDAHLVIDRVHLTDLDDDAPQEVFDDRGPETVMATGVSLTRTTVNRLRRPGKGSRFEWTLDRYGFPGGNREFTRMLADYTVYATIDRDFLGRLTTLRFDGKLGYIFENDAPTYERFYLGGGSFRGFGFRQVSPKGTPRVPGGADDRPIGGSWELFLGAQYEMPLMGEAITGVLFVDSGTVSDSAGFDDYRIAVGAGVRLYIPQLGNVPMAFDFGFPIKKQSDDETRVFTFSAELPF